MENKLIIAILSGLVLTAIMVFFVALQPASDYASGGAHPEFPAMVIGGDGERSGPILLPAYLWQVAVLATVSCMILLGVAHKHRTRSLFVAVGIVFMMMLVVWTGMVLSYHAVASSGETDYFLGFPVASAWLIYGVWLAQAGFTLIYVLGFRRYIFTADDEARFEAVIARKDDAEARP